MPGQTTRGDLDPNALCVALIFIERSVTDPYIRWACPLHPMENWVFGRWVHSERESAIGVMMDGLKRHLLAVHPDLKRETSDDPC